MGKSSKQGRNLKDCKTYRDNHTYEKSLEKRMARLARKALKDALTAQKRGRKGKRNACRKLNGFDRAMYHMLKRPVMSNGAERVRVTIWKGEMPKGFQMQDIVTL